MTDITIPREALEAALAPLTYPDGTRPDRIMEMRLVAMLKAWPGAIHNGHWLLFPHTKIPLPTENNNVEV
jgi:hypothetical protein